MNSFDSSRSMAGMLKGLEDWNRNHAIVNATCSSCKYEWRPYGNRAILLPKIEIIKCPKCRNREKHIWLDYDTTKRKDLGLKDSNNNSSNNNGNDIARIQTTLNESNKRIEQLEEKILKLETTVKDLVELTQEDLR